MGEDAKTTLGGATGAGATEQGNQQGSQSGEGAVQETKTYTAEELQAETDRRVTEAVKTANEKAQANFDKQLEEARIKWEKESKMTAEQREAAAREEAQKQFEQERSQFDRDRRKFNCSQLLATEKLPVEFADVLTGADDEATKTNIANFKDAFSKAVEAAVTERLKGSTPPAGGTPAASDPFLQGFGK